ncbi:NADP-dependent oxidoreductase [Emcibacter sp.]|uniref:NADP-dependent oxidoreductase n=1 Tax=Emcibacter sp. TaxID=1979954 RepID=UPI002AA7B04F|nr:NADP-dependent oxidoreductase [Emcibacter sp.]
MVTNRFWKLNKYPEGNDFESALSLETAPLAETGDGEVLIKNEYLSLDAGTRMWMTPRTDSYQPPLPLDSPMMGLGLGRVVASRHTAFKEGDFVRCFGQWADYSLVKPELSDLRIMDENVSDPRQHFGVVGLNGWTALLGLREVANTQAGDTVLVSAAAGATGILACQIAKVMGAKVYGLAGGPEKCAFLTDSLRIDGAVDYKNSDVASELEKIEGGIDVYFDNVGGPILDAVLPNMALHGRIAVCGLIASYAEGGRLPGPSNFDQILMKRLTVRGFLCPDFFEIGNQLTAQLKTWLEAGKVTMPFDETQGLENMLVAYAKLFTGANIGKVIVKL